VEFANELPGLNAAAEDITPNTFDGKAFRCPACGEYDIVGSVYEPGALKVLPKDKRRDALHRATIVATIGQRPRITTYDL
jgi:hypothetical protein